MFALRKFAWIFAALWILSQSAVFAHDFEEHTAGSDCEVCLQSQNDDHATLPESSQHQIPALEAQRLSFLLEQQTFCSRPASTNARGPPATV